VCLDTHWHGVCKSAIQVENHSFNTHSVSLFDDCPTRSLLLSQVGSWKAILYCTAPVEGKRLAASECAIRPLSPRNFARLRLSGDFHEDHAHPMLQAAAV
jgi:hypothetical protein